MAGLDIVSQPGFPFYGDDGSDLAPGQMGYGLDDLVQFLGHEVVLLLKGRFAHLGENPSDIALEHYDDDEKDGAEKRAEEPVQGKEIKFAGNKVNDRDEDNAQKHLNSPGSADQQDDTVYYDTDNQYVYDILPSE
jgi:hypothetical protein